MMNNTRPSFHLISSAMDGNVNPIEKILAFYDPYVSKCCLRLLYDRYGNVCVVIDMELEEHIRETLIKVMLDFDIPLETKEQEAVTAEHDLLNPFLPTLFLLLHESNTLSPQLFDN